MAKAPPRATFFANPAAFRSWLEAHGAEAVELWVGFHKRHTEKPSVTWPEAVDEALCFGWIDGIRKSLGESSYEIRFTPRKQTSKWSAVNVRRVAALTVLGRMTPPGLAAFARRAAKPAGYAYEERPTRLDRKYEAALRANKRAWHFFAGQAPWYQRTATFWVMSAVKEETRARRLATLIADSEKGIKIGPVRAGNRS